MSYIVVTQDNSTPVVKTGAASVKVNKATSILVRQEGVSVLVAAPEEG